MIIQILSLLAKIFSIILQDTTLSVCRSFAASSSDATLPTPTFEIKIQRIDGSSQRVDVSADMRPDFFRSWGLGDSMMGEDCSKSPLNSHGAVIQPRIPR